MILYVAGPMRGLPGKNLAAFNDAEKRLVDAGYRVVNPARHDDVAGMPYAYYMHAALVDLVTQSIDGLALLPDWQESMGASLEVDIAKALSLPYLPVQTWIDRVALAR